MKTIINGRIIRQDGVTEGKALAFDARIAGIVDAVPPDSEVIDARGGWVAPGLIDVHCHGFLGMDASHGDVGELLRMSEHKAKQGVTAWLPTTMTLPWDRLEGCFAAVRRAMDLTAKPGFRGARVLGCHAEGPFISPKRKGAQDGAAIQRPDIGKLRPWVDAVRLMTVAPEVEGAQEFIREAHALGVTLSMGHTDATAEEAMRGIRAGVTHATHLFNAMPPVNHRAPGAAIAALAAEGVTCELIADTFHVDPLWYPVLARAIPDRLVLITDSIPVSGLPDGPHEQLGVTVIVDGIRCRFPDGTIAGSALTLDAAVRNFARHAGVPIWQAVNMASLHPARAIGADDRKGAIAPGMDADIVIADEGFHIVKTFVGGECAWAEA